MARWHALGVPLDVLDQAAALAWVEQALAAGRTGWIATPNPEITAAAWRSPALLAALANADLCVADGVGMLLASRVLAGPLSARVPGIELLEGAIAACARNGWPVYFLGGKPGVAARAAANAIARWPGLPVAGAAHGYFTAAEAPEVVRVIAEAQPRLLAVGMGHPRQELWLAQHTQDLSGTLAIACGGSLDVLSGAVTRAPTWVRRANLEWLYRILASPRTRLARSGALLAFAGRVLALRLGVAASPEGES